jgi:hypothetical protein
LCVLLKRVLALMEQVCLEDTVRIFVRTKIDSFHFESLQSGNLEVVIALLVKLGLLLTGTRSPLHLYPLKELVCVGSYNLLDDV